MTAIENSRYALPSDLLRWDAAATHVHSPFPQNPTCSGKLTISEVVRLALSAGYAGVAFNEHLTDPGAPQRLSSRSAFLDVLRRYAAEVRDADGDVRLFSGVEANIMPDGTLDVPSETLAGIVDYIIASQHGGLGAAEKYAEAIAMRLGVACGDPFVHTIGHPSRYNDDVVGVYWPRIFDEAHGTNTLVELNLNLWFSKGPGRGRVKIANDEWYGRQVKFWRRWLTQLCESGAPVVIGYDAHNAGMWPQAAQTAGWETTFEHLAEFIRLLESVGFTPDRVINSSVDLFTSWIQTPKAGRHELMTW